MNEHQDPFDALRAPVVPVEPDPRFATELRARLARALLNPGGGTVTTSEQDQAMPAVGPSQGDLSYASLWLPDVRRAEAFYGALFGWRIVAGSQERGRRIEGTVPHLGMFAMPGTNTLMLCHAVDDIADAVRRIRSAGGEAAEPTREPFGVVADCTDNQGMRFAVFHDPVAGRRPAPDPRPGELVYLTVQVPDSAAFREFYGAVFGWRFTPGRVTDGWQVEDVRPMTGMRGGAERSVVIPMYRVADIAAAVARVRELGGTATDPARQPYGITSECADDQGTGFYLGQL